MLKQAFSWQLDQFFHEYTPKGAPGGEGVGRIVTAVNWRDGQSFGSVVKQMIVALDTDGAVVLSRAVSDTVCDAIQDEIAPYAWEARGISATTGGAVNEGYASGSNGSLLAKSTAVQAMAAHPAVVAAVEAVLG